MQVNVRRVPSQSEVYLSYVRLAVLLLSPLIPLSAGGPGDGSFEVPLDVLPEFAGFTLTFQGFVEDPAGVQGFAASNGLAVAME